MCWGSPAGGLASSRDCRPGVSAGVGSRFAPAPLRARSAAARATVFRQCVCQRSGRHFPCIVAEHEGPGAVVLASSFHSGAWIADWVFIERARCGAEVGQEQACTAENATSGGVFAIVSGRRVARFDYVRVRSGFTKDLHSAKYRLPRRQQPDAKTSSSCHP